MFNLIMFAFFLYPWYARIVLRIFIVILSGHWSRPGERSMEIFEQFFLDYLGESGRCWLKCLPGVLFMIHFRSDLKLRITENWFSNFFWSKFFLIDSSSVVTLYRLWLLNKILKGTSTDATSVHQHSFSFPTFEVFSVQVFEEILKYHEVTLHTRFLKNNQT